MRQEKRRWPVIAGVLLCLFTLALSIVVQENGYLTYLNSDMASEMILARRQADTGSLVQMDWLYSTEIHSIHMNLFYAFAFLFTPDFMWARIIGNTIGFVIAMASCVVLCRRLGLSLAKGLFTAALLPFAAGTLYASNVTVGGYYIIHMPFAFLGAALWLDASEGGMGRRKGLCAIAAFAALCMLEGLLSVRYVLCFVCPMVVVAALDVLLAPQVSHSLRDRHLRLGWVTMAGFMACLVGFVGSEILYPRLFTSGTGSASSFLFNPLDGDAMVSALAVVAADYLKLLGWRGDVPLFSLAGIANMCIAAVLVLGGVITVRVMKRLETNTRVQRVQRRMIQYAFAAFLVNLFCFVFIKGTYLNRYLILAVMLFIPTLTVIVTREKSMRLKLSFLMALCAMLGVSGGNFALETRAQKPVTQAAGADMMDAAAYLMENGYTHGYGDFWDVRVMQERTGGKLTFTGVVPAATEEGAACTASIDPIRWLEPVTASHIDACEGKTFLLLREGDRQTLTPWLDMAGAPLLYENDTYSIFGFESSQAMMSDAMFLRMKLENAGYKDGVYEMDAQGRMRVPTGFREAGRYALTFDCEGTPAQDSRVQIYATSGFEVIAQEAIASGRNEMTFELENDDKYFMILFTSGEAQGLRIKNPYLDRAQ